MKKIEIGFKPTANNRSNVLHSVLEKEVVDKVTAFRKSVYEMIADNLKGRIDQIQIMHHSSWDFGYSQVYYNGVFQGHLHEDFINCKFTFNPA